MIYDINPHTKPRMTGSDKWKKRPCVLHYRAFKDECRLKGVTIPDKCKIIFNIPIPKSASKKERAERLFQRHTQTPDIDNLIKGLFDAVLDDDAHISEVWAIKQWAETGSIEIKPLNALLSTS